MTDKVAELLHAATHLTDAERTDLIQALLQVRPDRPLVIEHTDCHRLEDGRFRHAFMLTNWTENVVIVNNIHFESPGHAGTKSHPPLLCAPQQKTGLTLEFNDDQVTLKLAGYRLPVDVRPAVLSQYKARCDNP